MRCNLVLCQAVALQRCHSQTVSPMLFIIVMEALSREFRTGCPWELLYGDDLLVVADTLEETWKHEPEIKGLKVNVGKKKVMLSSCDAPKAAVRVANPCGVCSRGVGQIQSSALSAKSGCISVALGLWVVSKRIPHLDAVLALRLLWKIAVRCLR